MKEEHKKLWQIVLDVLKPTLSEDTLLKTTQKIQQSFASGYGTVLFFEDQNVIKRLQKEYPLYQDRFPEWSQHTSGMHQLNVWMMLEEVGFGASLQHYNPLINKLVQQTWKLPENWQLIAQMPFGFPEEYPAAKTFQPLQERLKVFK